MQSTSREKLRNLIKEAHKKYKLPPGEFKKIRYDALQDNPMWVTRAYANNRYRVLVQDDAITTHGPSIRAMIHRLD